MAYIFTPINEKQQRLGDMEVVAKKVELIKVWLAVGLTIFGCILIVLGFWANPIGEIHNSVLIAIGEIFSFSGCVLGINYAYQYKLKSLESKLESQTRNGE